MPSPRDLLNKLKWDENLLERAVIAYVNRGSPGDEAMLGGGEIVEIGASFLTLSGGTMIPYHRIVRIEVSGRLVFERPR